MKTGRSRIMLCAAEPRSVADVRALLEHAGHAVVWHGINGKEPDELAGSHLIILDGSLNEEELLARAFLHETDHLYGKLYISHISALKRDLIRRKIRKMVKAGEWA